MVNHLNKVNGLSSNTISSLLKVRSGSKDTMAAFTEGAIQ